METLIIMPEIFKSKIEEAAADIGRDVPASSQSNATDLDSLPEATISERPVDLYKVNASFSLHQFSSLLPMFFLEYCSLSLSLSPLFLHLISKALSLSPSPYH